MESRIKRNPLLRTGTKEFRDEKATFTNAYSPALDAAVVRAELARHIDSITMTQTGEHYVASGNWNLVRRGSIGGAGGQNRTGYARLFRAALYQ
jgi:hypothetical protein